MVVVVVLLGVEGRGVHLGQAQRALRDGALAVLVLALNDG